MQLFGGYMAQADLDGVQSVGYTLLGMAIIAIVSVGILLQLPNIASGLAGGIGISYWYVLRTMCRAASGSASGARAVGVGGIGVADETVCAECGDSCVWYVE